MYCSVWMCLSGKYAVDRRGLRVGSVFASMFVLFTPGLLQQRCWYLIHLFRSINLHSLSLFVTVRVKILQTESWNGPLVFIIHMFFSLSQTFPWWIPWSQTKQICWLQHGKTTRAWFNKNIAQLLEPQKLCRRVKETLSNSQSTRKVLGSCGCHHVLLSFGAKCSPLYANKT